MEQVPYKSQTIIPYFLVIVLDSISFAIIAPILAQFLSQQNSFFNLGHSLLTSYTLYGVAIALFPLFYMVGAPLLGTLSDYYGRKIVLLNCLCLALLAFVSYAFAFSHQSIVLLFIARMLAGLSAASQGVAQAAVADVSSPQTKPHAMSFIAVGMTVGLVIGPLVAALWKPSSNWPPFILVILLASINILLLKYCVPKTPLQKIPPSSTWHSIKALLRQPKIIYLLVIFLLFELGWSMYFQTLPIQLSQHWHMASQPISFVSAYVGAALTLGLMFCMRWGLRVFSLRKLIQIGFVFGIVALFLLTQHFSLLLFCLLALPIVLGVAIIYPGIISLISNSVSAHQQGLILGLTDALLAFAFTLTGFFSSVVYYFNPMMPFLLAAFCWCVASVGYFYKS